ncbi:hypothetical protein AB6A40_003953 [Gnathostoma spinigerum]|uniref:Major facilitator superfamily (MFS) profile domain-containing protein n=1 Tax=Gnathostoma spinigerum TaxID=75299 RepID=A0ABD6EGI7_9BILA
MMELQILSDKVTVGKKRIIVNHYARVVILSVLTSATAIYPVGYHAVVLNVPSKVMQSAINDSVLKNYRINLTEYQLSVIWSTIVSSQSIGALIGCLLLGYLISRHGTKSAMLFTNNVFLLMGCLLMAFSSLVDVVIFLFVGRLLIGVHTGLSSALTPLFIQEIAPTEIKGALSCVVHIAVCFGAMAASILSLESVLGRQNVWGVLFAIPAVLCIPQMLASFYLPDTPNYLLREAAVFDAVNSIKFYYGLDADDYEGAIREYRNIVSNMPEQVPIHVALKNRKTRNRIMLGAVVSAAQIFCGSMATVSYSTSMFSAVSFIPPVIPFLPAIGSIISALLTLPALHLVETSGRRNLFLSALIICVIADYLFNIFSLVSQHTQSVGSLSSYLFAFAFFMFGVGYNLGVGPLAYFLPGELVSPENASAAMGLAVAVNWISTLVTTLIYYPLNNVYGGWSYLLFSIPSTIFLVILWKYLPETKFGQMKMEDRTCVLHNSQFCDYGTVEFL